VVHVAVTAPSPTLVLRYADVGIATYASLRVVGQPDTTVTWVIEEPALGSVRDLLTDALPDPRPAESSRDAIERAITAGSFATPAAEQELADIGVTQHQRGARCGHGHVDHSGSSAVTRRPYRW
jgi:hypothetical protein